MVSPLLSHNQHLLFYSVLSILASIWLILMALFCAAISRDSVFSLVNFWPRPDFLVRDVVYLSFKEPIELFFFPYLFPSYCHSVGHCIVNSVFDGCHLSSFLFFYEVLESLHRCVNAVFSAGKSSSSLVSWYI